MKDKIKFMLSVEEAEIIKVALNKMCDSSILGLTLAEHVGSDMDVDLNDEALREVVGGACDLFSRELNNGN